MVISIEVKGIGEVHTLFKNIPYKLTEEISKTTNNFIRKVAFDAKSIAPKDTGELIESIHNPPVIKTGNTTIWKAVADAPHAFFQEKGFEKHKAYISKSKKLSPGYYNVEKNTPFMKPAVELNIEIWKNHLKVDVLKAIRRSKR